MEMTLPQLVELLKAEGWTMPRVHARTEISRVTLRRWWSGENTVTDQRNIAYVIRRCELEQKVA